MDFKWADFTKLCRSIPGGQEVHPARYISKILKRSVKRMREDDYTVLLYSLGLLNAKWSGDIQEALQESIEERIVVIKSSINPRGLSNAIWGMGKMEIIWSQLKPTTTASWDKILAGKNGIVAMSSQELSMTLEGLASMKVSVNELSKETRSALSSAVREKSKSMNEYEKDLSLKAINKILHFSDTRK